MDYRTKLLALVGAYCEGTKRSEARVANLAGRDGKFFVRIREGRTCSVDTLNHVIAWFATNWPADLAWPEGVDRPGPVVVLPPDEDRRTIEKAGLSPQQANEAA